ncbi:MAG: hypothetical protein A2Y62_10850 [Candidatus Fischerbacteria bacterium RBG_13_37_8]|uniref:Major facilitator superfamily (MFS) profile domain-containing protein n=1 Tax=Candidatus Fischerbacteria bacterium RBG_13_37_8 TaxID=1817863 RepID=A0A1F5VUN5_9BACT|nr:MAG: hypothetical protein A2Y62_10850 [Candidatus Fischerbacteria bacterium RBG_13_37_8]
MGIINMIGNIGAFIGPIVTGKLIDQTGSFGYGFIFIAAVIILAGVLVIPVQETGRKRNREAVI